MKRQNKPMQEVEDSSHPTRCGARTRSGRPCRNPPVTGKARCRMHGGANGSGAQPGNTNALKHGRYCSFAREESLQVKSLMACLSKLSLSISNNKNKA